MKKITENNRLYLRKIEEGDLDRTWEWLHRPDIYTKIGVSVPFTKKQQKAWFEKLQQDKAKFVFAVCMKENDEHIGNVSLDMIDSRHRNARLSIFIAEKVIRGKGFGSDALSLLEEFAFYTLKLHKVWCKTDAGDEKVLAFYRNLGYIQEGIFKEHEIKNGKFVDKILFAKINSEKLNIII